jgi:hypothetical protein
MGAYDDSCIPYLTNEENIHRKNSYQESYGYQLDRDDYNPDEDGTSFDSFDDDFYKILNIVQKKRFVKT